MSRTCAWPYVLGSTLSGVLWGAIAYALGSSWLGPGLPGALVAAPVVGLTVGLAFAWIHRVSRGWRVLAALLSLYCGATLFGLAVGVADLLRSGGASRMPVETVLQAVPAVLWGLTFTGYVLFLWPLAYWNHAVLGRLAGGAGE